jgi:hypothetical protein
MYGYSFNVDGANFNDPGNSNFKTAMVGAGQSQVHIPGPVSREPAPGIARGAVAHHFYHSALIGDDRDFYMYAAELRAEPQRTVSGVVAAAWAG